MSREDVRCKKLANDDHLVLSDMRNCLQNLSRKKWPLNDSEKLCWPSPSIPQSACRNSRLRPQLTESSEPETIAGSVRKVNGIIHIIASRKFLKNRQESIKVATLVKFILPKTLSFFAAHPPLNWGPSDICKNIAEKTRLGWELTLYTVLCSTALYIFSKLDGISVLVLPDQNRFSLLLVRLAWNLNKPKFLSHGDLLESVIYLKTVHPMWPVTAKCLQLASISSKFQAI